MFVDGSTDVQICGDFGFTPPSDCNPGRPAIYARPVITIASNRASLPVVVAVTATTAVILPAFLTGAMAVQIRADLQLDESDIGVAIGVFFGGSAAGSFLLGRLAQVMGPKPAVRLGLGISAAADLTIVTLVDDGLSLQMTLAMAGLANALCQPAVNLLLVRFIEPGRLGMAMAVKQSGMPGAALLGGLAVPILALTVGWRAAFLVAAAVATAAIGLSLQRPAVGDGPATDVTDREASDTGRKPRPGTQAVDIPEDRVVPDQTWTMLGLLAAVGVLGGAAANIVVSYVVSGAVAAGIEPGPAGLLLTMGSALGIASRLTNGWLADRGRFDPPTTVVVLFAVGCLGTAALSVGSPTAYLLATPVAFASGWAWPGLFNLIVVQANRAAPAAATGLTQTGVYFGSLVSPIVAGVIIERSGYRAAWLLASACLAGAAALAGLARSGMRRHRRPQTHPGIVRPDTRTAQENR